MKARCVVTLPPDTVGDTAVTFAARARARGAAFLELRTDLHDPAVVDVGALARAIDLVVAERGPPLPAAWTARAVLVDRAVASSSSSSPPQAATVSWRRAPAPSSTLLSHHADAPLTTDAALARWGDVSAGPFVKHVEPLGSPQDGARLFATQRALIQRFGAGRVTVLATGALALPFRAALAAENALDYTALDERFAAAPGQRLLDDAVRAASADGKNPRHGILGHRIAASRSPRIHAQPFDRIDLPADTDLAALVDALRPLYAGFAVTSPFKAAAARIARSDLPAVNTLVRTGDGWAGANTDVDGARAALRALKQDKVTVLGDGGATAALRIAAAAERVSVVVARRADPDFALVAGPCVWTWPAHVEPPSSLAFAGAPVAVIAYGAPGRAISAMITARGGAPVMLGARWFVAQARSQRALWETST